MSKEFRGALYAIMVGLVLWAVKDHVDQGRLRDARLVQLEARVGQIEHEQRYYHGNPVPEDK